MSKESRASLFARLAETAKPVSANEFVRQTWALGHAPRPALAGEESIEAFLVGVKSNHGTLSVVRDRTEAVKAIARLLKTRHRTHRVVAGNDSRLAALPWRDGGLLPRFGAVGEGERVALSYARLGVAELGAIVTFTGRANPAANNLLTEDHIVLIDAKDIVASCEDAWEFITTLAAKEGWPRGINFIAGPSSTADIEGHLVYGAHGPRDWHVIVVGDVSEQAAAAASPGLPPSR